MKKIAHGRFFLMQRILIVLFFFVVSYMGGRDDLRAQEEPAKVASQIDSRIRCFSSLDCQHSDMVGICQDPGQAISQCLFKEKVIVPTIVIVPDVCRSCQTDLVISDLMKMLPGLQITYLNSSDAKAEHLKEIFRIEMLPAYIFSKEVEREESFQVLKEMTEHQGDYYYLKPSYSGASFFSQRSKERNQLDIFFILTQPEMLPSAELIQNLSKMDRTLKLKVHFVGRSSQGTGVLVSPAGAREIEEATMYCCIEKLYPREALDYLVCRLKNIKSLWWEDCLQKKLMNAGRIVKCARSKEGQDLLREKIKLSEELEVNYAPLFLMDNVEIFGVTQATTPEDIIRLLGATSNQ